MIRLLTAALAAAGIVASATGSASAYYDIFPRSSHDLINPQELAALDCETLWLARNEIYARNDYRFKTARGQAIFGIDGQQDSVILAGVEWENVAAIQKFEKAFACA